MKRLLPPKPHEKMVDKNSPSSKAADERREAAEVAPIVPNPPPSPTNSDEAQTRHYCKPDSTPRWKIILDSATFIAAATVAIIYALQLRQMIQSNQINRDALESVQRAFVIFGGAFTGNIRSGPAGAKERDVAVSDAWVNEGNTPAVQVIHFSKIDELSGEPDGAAFIGDKIDPSTYIGPKAHAAYVNTKPLEFYTGGIPVEYGTSTVHAARKIFLWGWVRYRDIIPNTPLHLTESCYQLDSIGDLPNSQSGDSPSRQTKNVLPMISLNWSGCATHNCTDQDCPDYKKIVDLSPGSNN